MNLKEFGQHLLAQKRAAVAGQRYLDAIGNGRADNSQRPLAIRPRPATSANLRSCADVNGWVSPLSEGLQNPQPDTPENPLSALPATVAMNPALLNGMVRNGQTSAGRLWLLCRAMDTAGSGVVQLATLRQLLANKENTASYFASWRRMRQIIASGGGVFWVRGSGRRGHGYLYLAGAGVVGRRLGVRRLERHNVNIAVADLLAGTKRARAAFYAAFHAGRRHSPISRATLARVTGHSERSQRVYDGMMGVQRQANYTLVAVNSKECAASAEAVKWQHGRAGFDFIDYCGQQGAAKKAYYAVRLPNSYTSPLAQAQNGRRKKIARALNVDLVSLGAQGNTANTPARLFHRQTRHALKASRLGQVYLHQQTTQQTKVGSWGLDRSQRSLHGWWQSIGGELG